MNKRMSEEKKKKEEKMRWFLCITESFREKTVEKLTLITISHQSYNLKIKYPVIFCFYS
jgi:hypothetical protein